MPWDMLELTSPKTEVREVKQNTMSWIWMKGGFSSDRSRDTRRWIKQHKHFKIQPVLFVLFWQYQKCCLNLIVFFEELVCRVVKKIFLKSVILLVLLAIHLWLLLDNYTAWNFSSHPILKCLQLTPAIQEANHNYKYSKLLSLYLWVICFLINVHYVSVSVWQAPFLWVFKATQII